jgi:hypothetical protein
LEIVKKIAEERNHTFQAGDILLLRTGFTEAFQNASLEAKKAILSKSPHEYPGMENTLEVLGWLFDIGLQL